MNQLEIHAGSCITGRSGTLTNSDLQKMREVIEWNNAVDNLLRRDYITVEKVVEMVHDRERGYSL